MLDDGVCSAFFFEQLEYGPDGSLHVLVWIEHDAAAIVDEANRQREAQLAPVRLVELAAVQARADDVQFGLG